MESIRNKLFGISAAKRIPITGAFELTPLCNFKCRMCYVRKNPEEVKQQGGLMPLDFWLDMAEQVKEAGTLSPLLTGGETFLYPHIRELFQTMHRMGMEVSINSNGSCITEETIEWLRDTPPTRINITLYGGSNATYEAMCGDPYGFDKVRRGVELLRENHIRFKFNCSLMPENAQDLEQMISYAKSYGMGLRVATYMLPPTRRTGQTCEFKERLTAKESAYYQVLTDWNQLTPEQFQRLAVNASNFTELTPEMIREAGSKPPRKMGCLAGRSSYWIDWQGKLNGCGMMEYPKVDLRYRSFKEAWEEIVDWTNQAVFGSYCGNCVNRQVCYTCAAMVRNETGNFEDRPVYLCEKAKYCAKYYKEFMGKLPLKDSEISISGELPAEGSCLFDEV